MAKLPFANTFEIFLGAAISGIICYLIWKLKRLDAVLENNISKAEIKEMIEDRVRPIEYIVKDAHADVIRLDTKVDALIRMLIENKNK